MIGMTVCSGIGAPELAAPWIDWRYQSEIDPFACAVLRERFPDATNLGDMTKYKEWPDATINVLCGGTPCQDISIGYAAGSGRAGDGMDGARSGLARFFCAIVERYEPEWVVWENVPNTLAARHSGGFLRFAAGLAECGYHVAWRVLDQRHLGFPDQPRPRLFVVGNRDPRRAAAVLLEPQSAAGNSAPREEAAPVLTARGGMAYDDRTPCVLDERGARIATPLEWERALGFPDNWTAIPWRGKPADLCPDGPRYKVLGNSWAGNCGEYIFDRIKMVEEMTA